MAENRFLFRLRRELAVLPEAAALIDQQGGLIVKLSQAASRLGEDLEDVASALAIGLIEAKQFHMAGEKKDYPLFYLSVLLAARQLDLHHAGGVFRSRGRSALALANHDGDQQIVEPAHFDDPVSILEACEAVSNLDPVLVSSQLVNADRDLICTMTIASRGGITARAARYRKAKARAAGVVQGDLFGGLLG